MLKTPDFEKCREWLEKVIPISAKVPSLAAIQEEPELYEMLKDGSELCRMIGLVTDGSVPQGITYRTNKISTLEQKNIKIFLSITEKDLKLKDVFGRQREDIFEDYTDFHKVLNGISKISKKVAKNMNTPGFECKSKKTESIYGSMYENISNVNSIYDDEVNVQETEHYEKIYDDNFGKTEDTKNIEHAVNELINVNASFLKRVLLNIKTNFVDKTSTPLMRDNFFPYFKVDKLIEVHEELKQEFELLKVSYHTIGSIFEKMRDKFLIYCIVTSRIKTALEFLSDQMLGNIETKESIRGLERTASKEAKSKDSKTVFDIKDLIQMIPQHIMRYPMMIAEIQKHAEKNKKLDILKEARKAGKIMNNIVDHIEKYANDHNYLEGMTSMGDEIKYLPQNLKNLHDYETFGTLKLEVEEVEMKLVSEQEFSRYQLLIFEKSIVASQLAEEETFVDLNWMGNDITRKTQVKWFSRAFRISDFDEVRQTKVKEHHQIFMYDYEGPKLNQNNSFILRYDDQKKESADKINAELKKLLEESATSISNGSEHVGHECLPYKKEIDNTTDSAHERCGSCDDYFLGKLQSGVNCLTCQRMFHVSCFSDIKSPDYDRETSVKDSLVVPATKIEDFNIGEANQNEAKSHLKDKRKGSFLLRESKNRFIITKKTHPSDKSRKAIEHLIIKKVDVNGTPYYFLEKGMAFADLFEVVESHRIDHKLFYPVNLPPAAEPDVDPEDSQILHTSLSTETMFEPELGQITDIAEENNPTIIVDDAHNLNYFYGDISKSDAEDLLNNKKSGDFLLRFGNGSYKISCATDSDRCKHTIVRQDKEGNFSITNTKVFRTIDELIQNYRNVEAKNSQFLGRPVVNPKADELGRNKPDDIIAQQRQPSFRKEPFSLQYYHGTMSSEEANRALQGKSPSTFLLRKNEDDEYRISYKKGHKNEHLRVMTKDSAFFLRGGEEVPFTSLRRLVDNLIDDRKIFSIPLNSDIRWTNRVDSLSLGASNIPGFEPSKQITDHERKMAKNLARFLDSDTNDETSEEGSESGSSYEDEQGYVNLDETEEGYVNIDETEEIEDERFPCVGKLSNKEAEAILSNKAEGTWLLRLNEAGAKRITTKTSAKILHVKIHQVGEGIFSLSPNGTQQSLNDLLANLEANGTLKKQITKLTK